VSVLGLGAMGSAVARALARAGERVVVWNRSPAKAAPLAALGAQVASTAEEAVRASLVAILVMLDATAARETLAVAPDAMSGRTIVNFSSGGPEDVAALRDLVKAAGGRYVGGGIVAYPRNIGHADTYIHYTGDAAAFEAHRALLGKLSGNATFLADADSAAMGPAVAVYMFAALGGFYEAVAIASRLGSSAPQAGRGVIEASRFFVLDAMDDAVRRLENGDFGGEQATVDVHVEGLDSVARSLESLGASKMMLDGFRSYAKRAQAAGLGGEDIASIIKVLMTDGPIG
jgi:3-hydroxyisobutyrate dehydrogenase-like beta-hydroxyacid dehydrogenase